MLYKHTLVLSLLLGVGILGSGFFPETTFITADHAPAAVSFLNSKDTLIIGQELVAASAVLKQVGNPDDSKKEPDKDIPEEVSSPESDNKNGVYTVPFYSQFTDISAPEWKKVGCGIASLAMLIEYYEPNAVSVDELLQEGIDANAFLSDAGWTHGGLISLSHKYGLTGESHSLAGSSMEDAFAVLEHELEEGPVMASVHYTFDPKNPIPHLVVVNGVRDGKVFYNDPSEKRGGGSVPIAQFQSAWKKRYIDIHPA